MKKKKKRERACKTEEQARMKQDTLVEITKTVDKDLSHIHTAIF